MADGNIHQLLLTRFNVRTAGTSYGPGQTPEWLEGRFDLFAQYCAPSVAAQTLETFDWVIFCDEDTDPAILDRIRAFDLRIRIALLTPYVGVPKGRARAPEPTGYVHPDVRLVVPSYGPRPFVPPGTGVVTSTRLDSDDALSRHALRRVRDHVESFLETEHPKWVTNPLHGFKLDVTVGKLYAASMPGNPFLTMFERVAPDQPLVGPFTGSHTRMHERYPMYEDNGPRLWLQVIHGTNLSNSIRARSGDSEVPLSELSEDFRIKL